MFDGKLAITPKPERGTTNYSQSQTRSDKGTVKSGVFFIQVPGLPNMFIKKSAKRSSAL